MAFNILTLDGGGIRGILTATLLERLEESQPGFLDSIDLIAGTSTGGILALGLASGMSPSGGRELYERLGPKVFRDSFWDNLRDLGQARGAQYSNKPLRQELESTFGGMKLNDLNKRVLISSFDLDNEEMRPNKSRFWKPKYFHNFPGEDSDGSEKVVDVALRTSAAPTFFPVYQGYIDGGVVANNPSMCAVAQALEPHTGGQRITDVRLLSVGTGYNPHFLDAQDEDWGFIQWIPHLITLFMDGAVGLADYQCKQLLGKRYHRLNVILPKPMDLDAVDEIPTMKLIANQLDLTDTKAWLKRYFKKAPKV
jgi:patatin-like phospholipase/acyl hydrolase